MIYAQIKSGRKLHLAMQPGERDAHGRIVESNHFSYPICGQPMKEGSSYRMMINVPLGHSCKKCRKVASRLKANFPKIDVRVSSGIGA